MLMTYVGPEYRGDLVPASRESWARLVDAMPDLVAELEPDFRVYGGPCGARAAAVLNAGPFYRSTEHAWVVLSDRFFTELEATQLLTLAHEIIHLVMQLGPLRDRAIESVALGRDNDDRGRRSPDPTGFADARYRLAAFFRTFAEEVLAEQFLQRRYPAYAGARVSMCRTMREEFAAGDSIDRTYPLLRCLSILYEIVRNDLGASISTEQEDRDAFVRLADALVERMHQECDEAEKLLAMRPRLLAVDLDTRQHDFTAFNEMWDMVMNTNLITNP